MQSDLGLKSQATSVPPFGLELCTVHGSSP